MKVAIRTTVNGRVETRDVDPRMVLVDFLREELGLTGTHVGCGTGSCGACTVALDGATVKSCCVLAADVDGASVETIESLDEGPGKLDAIQQAFVDRHGLQCGFCTPGMILSARQLLDRSPDPSPDEIREAIAGNLCRCTGYVNIIAAIRDAADRRAPNRSSPREGKP